MQEQDWRNVRKDTLKYLGQIAEQRDDEELYFTGHVIAMHLSRVVDDPRYGKVLNWEVDRKINRSTS